MPSLDQHLAKDGFRLRGTAMSRVDGFSDVVFGFALTLLVVSLEVPHTFAELNASLRGFLPFAVCFLILLSIWYSHYTFFRRYGLHDTATIVLNATLLFVVLYYVYPLKFLFTMLTNGLIGRQAAAFGTDREMRELMLLYGVGFMAVYLLFTALYWNAWRQRSALAMNAAELLLTKSSLWRNAVMAAVGLVACVAALLAPAGYAGMAGLTYLLLIVVGRVHHALEKRQLRRLSGKLPVVAAV